MEIAILLTMAPSRGRQLLRLVAGSLVVATLWTSCLAFHSISSQEMRWRWRLLPTRHDIMRHRPAPLTATRQSKWQAGDVEYDFARLEQAIAFYNADQNLQHQERLETLDYFAQQRRPVAPDLIHHVTKPLLFSFAVALVLKSTRHLGLWSHRLLLYASALHFWCLVVLAPVLAYGGTLQTKRPLRKADEGAYTVPPSDFLSLMDSSTTLKEDDSSTSTRDFVHCLLEQWLSAIAGGLAFIIWRSLARASTRDVPGSVPLLLVQLIARLGVQASLHQYPKLWFALVRAQQPRPVAASVQAMQCLTQSLCTPWFVALDLALYTTTIAQLQWSKLCLYYGASLFLTGVAAAALSPQRQHQHGSTNFLQRLGQLQVQRPPIRIMMQAALLGWTVKHRQSILAIVNTMGSLSMAELLASVPWSMVMAKVGWVVAVGPPIGHLWAVLRLLRVQFTHGLSLAMDSERYNAAIDGLGSNNRLSTAACLGSDVLFDESAAVSMQWRYRLSWREPQRIHVTLAKWRRMLGYWLLVAGSVDDKLRREYRRRRRGETKARGLTVLQRVAKNPTPQSRPDRTSWKANAMGRVAKMHQDDYDLKTFNDPLGIAVQQTLGIGLGFHFDHNSDLNSTECPSTRRLQARAAKSAIRRVQELYDVESARAELDAITDQGLRDERALELQRQTTEEIQQLADRLTDLIPTDLTLDRARTTPIQLFDSKNFKKVSSNEYVMSSSSSGEESSPALDFLLRLHQPPDTTSYEIDYLNPMGDKDSHTSADDEFIDEWKRRSLERPSNETDSQDDGNDLRTVLA